MTHSTKIKKKEKCDKQAITLSSTLSHLTAFGQKVSKSCLNLIEVLSKPKLKVAIISYYYKRPIISGVGVHVQNLAKYLAIHNCEVHVFCNSDEYELYKENGAFIHGMGKVLTPAMDSFSKKRLGYDLFESEVIKEIIKENSKKRFDIIHTHGALTKAAFIIKNVYGIKWVHTFHAIEKLRINELSEEEKQFKDLISWIEHTVNYSDGAIFVSKKLSEEGKKHYKLKSRKVIPNGVDFEMFNYHPLTAKNVLFIGRFSKEKGVDILPKLIDSIMSIEDATFTVVCPYNNALGGELKQIREDISKLEEKYQGRLKIIDSPQDQEVLKNLYKNCQVYIQPSKYESFGLCILEAMATGRPVVALKVGGIPEVIGDSGYTLKNKEELIYKVKELLSNRKECVMIGKRANKRAKSFDWETIAQKIIKYYKEVKK